MWSAELAAVRESIQGHVRKMDAPQRFGAAVCDLLV
jgi:hypothetical protein